MKSLNWNRLRQSQHGTLREKKYMRYKNGKRANHDTGHHPISHNSGKTTAEAIKEAHAENSQ